MPHDMVLAYRNWKDIPRHTCNMDGAIVPECKIIDGRDVPHKAFGAYRHYFNKYADKYDNFAFVSDDVVVKADGWLLRAITLLRKHDRCGWVNTQILNNAPGWKYFDRSHGRAPIWFAKTEALRKVNWRFNDDHAGEMDTGDQFVEAGFFGVQVGNKFDVAYDAIGGTGPGEYMEAHFFGPEHCPKKFQPGEVDPVNARLRVALESGEIERFNVGTYNLVSHLEAFHGLIYDRSLLIAEQSAPVGKYKFEVNLLEDA